MKTQTEIELDATRHALNNPKLALFQTTKLQRRLGELLRQAEQEKESNNGQLQQATPQTKVE